MTPETASPSISTRKLKLRKGSCRASGIVGHLQVGEVAISGEVVAELAAAAVAVVRPPGDRDRELGRLFAGKEELRAVEEDANAAVRREELEAAEDLQPVDALLATEAVQRLGEANAHGVGRQIAEVLECQEQEAAVELDAEDDVGLADGGSHEASLFPSPGVRHRDERRTL